jgi:hypothetical protein
MLQLVIKKRTVGSLSELWEISVQLLPEWKDTNSSVNSQRCGSIDHCSPHRSYRRKMGGGGGWYSWTERAERTVGEESLGEPSHGEERRDKLHMSQAQPIEQKKWWYACMQCDIYTF